MLSYTTHLPCFTAGMRKLLDIPKPSIDRNLENVSTAPLVTQESFVILHFSECEYVIIASR